MNFWILRIDLKKVLVFLLCFSWSRVLFFSLSKIVLKLWFLFCNNLLIFFIVFELFLLLISWYIWCKLFFCISIFLIWFFNLLIVKGLIRKLLGCSFKILCIRELFVLVEIKIKLVEFLIRCFIFSFLYSW